MRAHMHSHIRLSFQKGVIFALKSEKSTSIECAIVILVSNELFLDIKAYKTD